MEITFIDITGRKILQLPFNRILSVDLDYLFQGIYFYEIKNNKEIIKSVAERLVFNISTDMQHDMEQIIKYDFNPTQPNAQQAVTRLAEYILKSPEYQII